MIFFLPYILADVAAGLVWRFMSDVAYCLPALLTGALGLAPYYLLADKTWTFSAAPIVILWEYFGFHMMLYAADLQSIDKSLLQETRRRLFGDNHCEPPIARQPFHRVENALRHHRGQAEARLVQQERPQPHHNLHADHQHL